MLLGFRVRLLGFHSMRTRPNSQHANLTEFCGSDSRNLLNWVPAATVSVRVALESACIMLVGFRVRLLGLRSAHFRVVRHLHPHLLRALVIADRTYCEVYHSEMAQACAKAPSPFPPSSSAPVAQSPTRMEWMEKVAEVLCVPCEPVKKRVQTLHKLTDLCTTEGVLYSY